MEVFKRHIDIVLRSIIGIAYQHILKTDRIKWFGDTQETLGFPMDKMPKDTCEWLDGCHPEDHDNVLIQLAEAIKTTKEFNIRYRLITKSGDYRFFHDIGFVVDDEIEGPVVIGVMTDITSVMNFGKKMTSLIAKLETISDS